MSYEVYEIPANLGHPPISLENQIAMGCNDWKAETDDGAVFFGRTEQEARTQAEEWLDKR